MLQKQNKIKPVQLISFDSDKNLVLSQQAIDLFKTFQAQQLHIVTVAGKYRTGKSYILNRVLLNQNNGFEVGPTINACTKGLWMWPKIVEIGDQQTNSIKKCIIIDTEGLGSLQEGQNTDMKIFLMAVLLSSYLIYNSVGNIDQKALQSLSLITNLAELLHKNQNQYDSQQLINSFPSFMWLVRDFSLRLQNEQGQPITSQEYLQNALKYQAGNSQASERKNSIRRKLKTFFQERNCFTLIRPTQNQKDLQNLSTLNQRKLRPQFIRLINQFKQIIKNSLKPKRVRGKAVTPQGFIQVCKYFVITLNSGKLPSINSHWDNLCLKQASRIMQYFTTLQTNTIKQLHHTLSDKQPIQQLLTKTKQIHKNILQQSSTQIDKSFLGKLQKQLCKQKLQRTLTKLYQSQLKQINTTHSITIKNIGKQIFKQIMQQFQNNKLQSFQQIFRRFQELKQKQKCKYDFSIYQSFYQNSKDVFQEFLRSLKEEWDRDNIVLNQKNMYLEHMVVQKTEEFNMKLEDMENIIRELQSNNYKLQIKNTQLQSTIQTLKKQSLALNQQTQQLHLILQQYQSCNQQQKTQQLQTLQQSFQQQLTTLQNNLHKCQIQLAKQKQLTKQSSIKQRKTQRQMQIFKNKCTQYLKQNLQLNQKLEKVNKNLLELGQNYRKQVIKQNINFLPEIVRNMTATISQQEIKLKIKQEEIRNLVNMVNSQKIAHQTLLRAPQNINYSVLKKNYEMQKQTNTNLLAKIKDYQLISILFSYKCLICSSRIDKNNIKSHISICTSLKPINFDVSYQYNGNGQIQFVIDVYLDDQQWTIRKTLQNIKYFMKKMNIQNNKLFQMPLKQKQRQRQKQKQNQEDIGRNQQRRIYLDQLFNQFKEDIWGSTFLIQYFGIDLNFLNCKHQKLKNGRMKSSKMSMDIQQILEQNIEPTGNNILMKTDKFSKKTFNFGHV